MITAINKNLALEIEVPIACFRQSRAREYAETYPFPHHRQSMECYCQSWEKPTGINIVV